MNRYIEFENYWWYVRHFSFYQIRVSFFQKHTSKTKISSGLFNIENHTYIITFTINKRYYLL